MAFSAMVGGAETYLSAFAIFLKANAPQVALLTTLPPLVGSSAQFLAAWLGRRLGRRRPVIVAGAVVQGLTWLPLLALPLLFPDYSVPLLLLFVTTYYAGGHLTAPLWTSLMGDLVPERRRGRYFGRRTRLTTITTFAALVAAGVILDVFAKWRQAALGFAVLFVSACLFRLTSAYHVSRMSEPTPEAERMELSLDRAWLDTVRGNGALWFSLYFVLLQGTVAIASPFFAVYMLRDLHFSYLQFMANTGTAVLMQFLTLNTWGRVGDVFGNRLILAVTSMTVPALPVLWVISNNFWWLLAVQCLSGLSWAGLSLSAGNMLYDLVPARQRATYTAFHNVLVAGGVFLGSMVGAGLFSHMPAMTALFGDSALKSRLLPVFVVSTLARVGVAGIFLRRVRDLKKPRKAISARQFVFRATRFSAFVGIAYEFVTLFRKKDSV